MKKDVLFKLMLILMFLILSYSAFSQSISINWDQNSARRVSGGVYGRVKKISTGELLLVYSEGPDVVLRRSSDEGNTWSDQYYVTGESSYNCTNSELIELDNGWLIYAYNGRPISEYTVPYTIKTLISRDKGYTWTDKRLVYTADVTFENGCWEPAMLQLPSGEIQIYFANENPYRNSAEQEISLMRSFDNGLTWGDYKTVSFRAGFRDGMPVPLYLNGGKGIVFAIEDLGGWGNFKPSIIWTSIADNWYQEYADAYSTRRWRAEKIAADSAYLGAPYIVQLPAGETLLCVQSNVGRDENASNMQVYIGDDEACNFHSPSTPWPALPAGDTALWNSLCVLDNDTVIAVSSISGTQGGVWIIKGKIKRTVIDTGYYYSLAALHSGKGVHVDGWSMDNGANILQWDNNYTENSQWQFIPTDNGYYRIMNRYTGKCLETGGLSDINGGNVQQWDWLGHYYQQWSVEEVSNGLYKIINRGSGRCLDVDGGPASTGNGINIFQWEYLGSTNQQWQLETLDAINPGNISPVINIISPDVNSVFNEGDNVTINVSASDADGFINLVEFFIDSVKIGEDSTAPYSISLNNISAGDHIITAAAADNEGSVTNSAGVNITVTGNSESDISVEYNIVNDWGSGFTCEITITNNSAAVINGWELNFTFPGNQIITSGWNAIFNQSGQNASISNLDWNAVLQNGQSVTVGFNGNYSGVNYFPQEFIFNGVIVN